MKNRLYHIIAFFALSALLFGPFSTVLRAQNPLFRPHISHLRDSVAADSARHVPVADSARFATDSVRPAPLHDSLIHLSPNAITNTIAYKAADSIAIDLSQRTALLYTSGNIDYDHLQLTADRIQVSFNSHTLQAKGVVDTLGHYNGRPFFVQDGTEYNADSLIFNYDTRKGIISGVITQEGDGFLHGSRIKKLNDSVMYLESGQYTTCNYAHPHFAINFTHSKLIANDKIITGPAYLTVADIPTPLALPFAFFPLSKNRTSGLIMPSYGWMNGRGYYLRNGGYYWAINDYADLSLLAEIYTNLSWRAEAKSQYAKRYKYKGSFDISYGRTKDGIRGDTANYNVFGDFKVAWKHDQDPKANPSSRFSADVNLTSRNYSRNTTNRSDFYQSTTTSSVSYTAQLGSAFNLAAAFNESYNVQTGLMNIKLPSVSLSSNTFYPFRRKEASGSPRWYENISMSYVFEGSNNVSAQDSNLLKKSIFNAMQYGVQQRLPISSSVKVLRFFNWTNSLSYNERWHWSTIEKHIDTTTQALVVDTLRGFRANRDFSYTSTLTTRIYGMFNFKYGPVKALRHVVNPSLSFNYRPDFGAEKLGYWRSYTDTTGYVHRYSIFEQSLYGGPADGRSGRVQFSVGNNLEMKYSPLHDTTGDLKKFTLIENLNLSMFYDIARDSLNWSDLSITGRTTLFKNLILNYSGSFIPYEVDSLGNKHNQLLWDTQHRFFRRDQSTWSAQLSWNLNNKTFSRSASRESNGQMVAPTLQSPYYYNPALLMGNYADFSLPWNLSFNYTFSYVSAYDAALYNFKSNVVQTLSFNGNFNLTDKWRFNFSSGYDFVNKGMSYTSIDIYRDLHCWEMRFNWIPFGYYKSWNFSINIKADSLKDVKWNKEHSYQSNKGYYTY